MKLRKATRASVARRSANSVRLGTKVWHQAAGRPASCASADEIEAAQRRRRSRLDDHRAAHRDGRRHLVDDQVQRMVEGRNGHHHADRLLDGEGPAAGAGGGEAHGHFMAGEVAHLAGGVAHAIDGARHLHPGIGQRLAALARDQAGKLLVPPLDQAAEPAQDVDALMRLQPAVAVAEYLHRRGELGLHRRFVIGVHLCDRRTVIGLHDVEHWATPIVAKAMA